MSEGCVRVVSKSIYKEYVYLTYSDGRRTRFRWIDGEEEEMWDSVPIHRDLSNQVV
jgi:hypothetical protein